MDTFLKEVVKPLLEKIIKYIDAKDYWMAYGIIVTTALVFLGTGYFISWFMQTRKLKKEIDKLTLESKEKAISILEKLQARRKLYLDNVILIQLSVELCIESIIRKDIPSLDRNREELINLFFNEVTAKLVEYIETCEIFFKDDCQKLTSCIIDEIFPFLDTTKMFIDTVNNPNILNILGKDKVLLKEFSIKPMLRFIEGNLRFYQFIMKYRYKKKVRLIDFDATT